MSGELGFVVRMKFLPHEVPAKKDRNLLINSSPALSLSP
jgi:hypothetical protein